MSNRRIKMITYESIIRRLREGDSMRSIERAKLAGKRSVSRIKKVALEKGWLDKNNPLPCERDLQSVFQKETKGNQKLSKSGHIEKIIQWTQEGYQARTIYNKLKNNFGYDGSYDSVQRFIKKLQINNLEKVLTTPLHFKPAEAAQVDFGHGPKIFDNRTKRIEQTYFFVMTLCFSRHQFAFLVTHQDIETWLFCHQKAFEFFKGVPCKVIIDNPKCAVVKAGYYDVDLNNSYEQFAKEWKFQISPCPPRDPQKKGRVESGVKYIKKSFLPLRTFKDMDDANDQLLDWILNEAGQRIHGSTHLKPLESFEKWEKLNPLPLTKPEIAIWSKTKGSRNGHIIHNQCHYSFPYQYFGCELWVKQTPGSITIYCDGEIIAKHQRLFIKGSYATKEDHLPKKAKYFLKRTPTWCIEEAQSIGPHTLSVIKILVNDPVQDHLRVAQGILNLSKSYGKERLEKACERAFMFKSIGYKTIKCILEKNIDSQEALNETSKNPLSKVYQGDGKCQRAGYLMYQTSFVKH
ncbi:MAG: hypothetical protein FADNKDHG_01481 [Holosporales bacterium]